MPFNADGSFTRLLHGADTWRSDAAAGTRILATRHDDNDNDFASGLSDCITKTGHSQPTADIPMAGHRIVNLGNPVVSTDAANKDYVDKIRAFDSSLTLSGADTAGRLTFTGTGTVGTAYTVADLSWLARPALKAADNVTVQQLPRLVLNNTVDGTNVANDVVRINDLGHIATPFVVSSNTAYDGSSWRTIAAGYISAMNPGSSAFNFWGNDTATANPYQVASVRQFASLQGASGNGILQLFKSGATSTVCRVAGLKTGSGLYRWIIDLGNATAESGANAGSDFSIYRYSDTGAGLGEAFNINRSTGSFRFSAAAANNYTILSYSQPGAGAVIGFCANTAYYGILGYQTSGGIAYSFYGNGSALNSSAWQVSDARAKDNIADVDSAGAYAQMRGIPVKSYLKKQADSTIPEIGWLAQDIETVVPEAVMDVEIPMHDTGTRTMIGSDTMKATNDRTMLATLWAAVQHQAAIIEALQARITALEAP